MRRLGLILAALLALPVLGPFVFWGLVLNEAPQVQAALTTPITPAETRAECLRLEREPPDYFGLDSREFRNQVQRWRDICGEVHTANATDPGVMLSLARVMMSNGERDAAVPMFKTLAAQDNVKALSEIYEYYKSWEHDLSQPRKVTRAEAEAALRRAAELGDVKSMNFLLVRLIRGSMVKRDLAEARIWAERLLANPKDDDRVFTMITYARLLAMSDKSEERARGLANLETLAKNGRGDAKAKLAKLIRKDDPARARKLLEEALSGFAGHAVPQLADMLIKGEGGPADAERAVHLLKTRATDVPSVRAALGQLMLDGKYVPRNIKEGLDRIVTGAMFDYERKIQAAHLYAANPDVASNNASGFLFDLVEFADLREPGAREALATLKLSAHPQFADKAGACALVESDDSLRSLADRCRG
jgi:TPR repeat protein